MKPIDVALFLAAGAALGALYFILVYRTARLHAAAAPLTPIVALYLVRLGLAAAAFWLIAQQGAIPLLLALAGFIAARMVVLRCAGAR
jgi:F1F0 ATPase subunit 2